MKKALLVFDGDCGFCRRWVEAWREEVSGVDFEASQTARKRFTKIPPEKFEASVVLLEGDGQAFFGAEAVFRLLALGGRPRYLRAYKRVPGFKQISEACYAAVAANRVLYSRLTTLLWGEDVRPASTRVTCFAFLRLLSLIYFCAFASLYSQIAGLIGPNGILPAGRYLELAQSQLGNSAVFFLPGVFWWGASDFALKFVCALGAALSLVCAAGFSVGPILAALWFLYLSIVSVGQEFLSFQWDILLLETGFLALLVAPWGLRSDSRKNDEPPAVGLWLIRWLAARLMLESGLCKLASGDPTWRSLTALNFHYLTQPLPTRLGWWAHQLPGWFQSTSCALMFAVELGAPVLALMPRRPRALAAVLFIALQLLIMLTGNYGFFNLLSIALSLALLDDAMLGPDLKRGPAPPKIKKRLAWAFAVFSLPLSFAQVGRLVFGRVPMPPPLAEAYGAVSPLHLVNGYGLFAVMTTKRDEIKVEGSLDGKEWREYRFKHKPGPLNEPPKFVAPHMPRLDWQMWFAALGSCRDNPWFVQFLAGLAQGKPAVKGLLYNDPFPEAPPRYLRTTVAEYRFTTPSQRRATGNAWTKTEEGPYCPILAVRDAAAVERK